MYTGCAFVECKKPNCRVCSWARIKQPKRSVATEDPIRERKTEQKPERASWFDHSGDD
jgi:hypothetical protein